MTTIEKLRKMLADPYKYAEDGQESDGSSTVFELNHAHIKADSYTVYIGTTEQVEDTDFTIDLEAGVITFTNIIDAGELIRVIYQFSAFSDTDLQYYLDENTDDLNKSQIMAIDELLMDASRRFDYSTGKSEMKPKQVFDNLLELRKILIEKSNNTTTIAKKVKRTNQFYEDSRLVMTDYSRLEGDPNGFTS